MIVPNQLNNAESIFLFYRDNILQNPFFSTDFQGDDMAGFYIKKKKSEADGNG